MARREPSSCNAARFMPIELSPGDDVKIGTPQRNAAARRLRCLLLPETVVITLCALAILAVFFIGAIPRFDLNKWALEGGAWLPKGWTGVFRSLPFALWVYLGIEQLPSPIKVVGGELPVPTKAPTPGEHTAEILKDALGYDDARIAALRDAGAFGKKD